jgi:hypothetical protein
MIPGFGLGTTSGLLFITLTGVVAVVCAEAEPLSENPTAAIKITAPIANALRKLCHNL